MKVFADSGLLAPTVRVSRKHSLHCPDISSCCRRVKDLSGRMNYNLYAATVEADAVAVCIGATPLGFLLYRHFHEFQKLFVSQFSMAV